MFVNWGFNISCVWVFSYGVPVVTADVGGQKELIDNTCGRVIRKYQSVDKDLYNFNYDKNEIEDYKKLY